MKHSQFWERMEFHLGEGYAPVWADQQVLAELGGRTVNEALAAGVEPKTIWRAVASSLELDEIYR